MQIPDALERWSGKVQTVRIGATQEEGGTRPKVFEVGGEIGLPFLKVEGETLNPPVVAMEVWDIPPSDWPGVLTEPIGDGLEDPAQAARMCGAIGAHRMW